MIWQKLLVLIGIAIGEALMIAAQVFGSKASADGVHIWQIFKLNSWYIWVSIVGVFIVLAGYLYGIKVFNNIWLVTMTSWTGLVLAEIILAYIVFKTVPEGTVLIGFILATAGFIIANL